MPAPRMDLPAPLLRLLTLGLVIAIAAGASADEVSGTWTGELLVRGNYFYEASTRVMAPYGRLRLESPGGIDITADYLLDAISSASIAQTGSDEDRVHTELRHAVGLTVGSELELAGAPLYLSATGRFSSEPDYTSRIGGLGASLSLDQRATVLHLATSGVYDTIRDNRDPDRSERLKGISWRTGVDQVLTPHTTLSLGYDGGYLRGFIANIYRTAPTTGANAMEMHPPTRWRHTFHGRVAQALPAVDAAVHLMYRFYTDSWDLRTHNPEVRWYQMLGEHWLVRLRYRYYTQDGAFFWQPEYNHQALPPFVTGDPKVTRFRSHLVGLKLQSDLGYLSHTPLAFLHRATADVLIERMIADHRFGPAWVGQAGLRMPF